MNELQIIERILSGELPPLPGMRSRKQLLEQTGLTNYRGYLMGWFKPDSQSPSVKQ
jgi:hypothetical protein